MVLRTVVSQQLLPGINGDVVPAYEIMHRNNAIRSMAQGGKYFARREIALDLTGKVCYTEVAGRPQSLRPCGAQAKEENGLRTAQKKQAEEFVASLSQANSEIRKAMEHEGQAALAMDLLGQCQEGAISLGSMIEQIEGENTAAVSLLEEYCELLYRYHEKIRQELPVKAEKEYEILQNSISGIKNSIQKDIPVRKEIVFLPYKASMWDALESIWEAADADPNCDAYVIPIPYYDKAPDGSFKKMHYEGNLYPKNVPIVWYEDYNFAQRRPDAIFIHNPYDHINRVTSVHPDFYSSKLNQYTDKLVYIPYFIWEEVDPEDKKRRKTVEPFCWTPGVLNADIVVVQSEAMRQIYIDVLSKNLEEHTREDLKQKIFGFGSPKVDKVLRTSKEELEIPEHWLKIIQKADGSWKKIVFYNTSLGALLEQKAKMLAKMNAIFKLFQKNRNEIAFLWRPHPLFKPTISSMLPRLLAIYEAMLQQYLDEGWGIYDDTPDLDRAVILCNAYYGDMSSVAELCSKAGKAVMLQDVMKETALEDILQLIQQEKEPASSADANVGYEIYHKLV